MSGATAILKRRLARLVAEPAVHFIAVGAVLFLVAGWRGPSAVEDPAPGIVVAPSQVAAARVELESRLGRSLTPQDEAEAVRMAVDREVLLHHALVLGLDGQPEIEGRLAQIAAFVADDASPPQDVDPTTWWAAEAKRLGLARGDRVARSLLIDRARRLIRAAVLIHEPSEAALEAHLRDYPEVFERPAELAVDVVFLGRGRAGDAAMQLQRLRAATAEPDASWSAMPPLDLERRLGSGVVAALGGASVGDWLGPLESRDGPCLLRVRSAAVPPAPTLDDVRARVRARLRQHLADVWLEERMGELRERYGVRIDAGGRAS